MTKQICHSPALGPAITLLSAAAIVCAAMFPTAALAQGKKTASPADQAVLLGQFGDWGAYTASPGGKKVCFALSKPLEGRHRTGRPQPRRFLCLHLDASGREGEERGVGDCRLSAEAQPRCLGHHRFRQLRHVHAERRRLGQECRRRGADGGGHAQGRRSGGQDPNPPAAPSRSIPIPSRASARRSTRSRRSASRAPAALYCRKKPRAARS